MNIDQLKPLSGIGVPTSIPSFIGQHYINTTTRREYIAAGISSSADWVGIGAAAWVTFTVAGGACTVVASYNVSTVTYYASGRYIINFTNNLPNTNYCVQATGNGGGDSFTTATYRQFIQLRTRAVGSVQVQVFDDGGATSDATTVCVTVFN